MKTKKLLIGLGAILLLSISLTSCLKLFTHTCPDGYPYYCSSSKECCPSGYTYHANNGNCYASASDCRSQSYGCELCI